MPGPTSKPRARRTRAVPITPVAAPPSQPLAPAVVAKGAKRSHRAWWISALLALTFLLRLPWAQRQIVTDEGKYLLGIDYPGNGLIVHAYAWFTQHGVGLGWITMISALFAVATAFLLVRITDRLDSRLTIPALVVFAFLPSSLVLSETALLDVPLAFFWALALERFLAMRVGARGLANHILIFLAVLCAGLLKPQGVLIAVMLVIILFVERWRRPLGLLREPLLYALVLPAIPFSAEFLAHPYRFGDILTYFTEKGVAQHGFLSKLTTSVLTLVTTDGAIIILAAIAAIALLVRVIRNEGERVRSRGLVDVTSVFLLTLVAFFLVLTSSPYYLPIFAVPACVLVAWLWLGILDPLRGRAFHVFAACAVLALIVHAAIFALTPLSPITTYLQDGVLARDAGAINGELQGAPVAMLWDYGHEWQYYLHSPTLGACALTQQANRDVVRYALSSSEAVADWCGVPHQDWSVIATFSDGHERVTLYEHRGASP